MVANRATTAIRQSGQPQLEALKLIPSLGIQGNQINLKMKSMKSIEQMQKVDY